MINAYFFRTVHLTKAELGFALGSLIDSDGHLTAEIIFDESSFVTGALLVPGVHAENGEIARLPLGVACTCHQILRFVSGGTLHAVQFKPGGRANVGGGHAFTNRLGQIEFNKASHYPSGDGNRLVARLRGGVGFGTARGSFPWRARG